MADPQAAVKTQLANIEKRTGKNMAELTALAASSGLAKHGELRDYFKRELALGYGDANARAQLVLSQRSASTEVSGADGGDALAAMYSGPKEALKGVPATDRLLALPPGGMCNYKIKLTDADEVDGDVVAWVRQAFEGAG